VKAKDVTITLLPKKHRGAGIDMPVPKLNQLKRTHERLKNSNKKKRKELKVEVASNKEVVKLKSDLASKTHSSSRK
jgi:hypothetical protein